MTKFALITDTHIGVRGDSPIFYNVQKKFYQEIFFPYLKENSINRIIHLGDFFDTRKYITLKSIENIKECFLDPLEESNIKMIMILGNHDVALKNTNRINSPELLLRSYPNIFVVSEPINIHLSNKNIGCFIPWINNENQKEYMEFMNNTKANICFGHFDIKDCNMNKTQRSSHGISQDTFDKFLMTFSGHFHIKSKTRGIQYLGNPFHFDWGDYGDQRGFHIFDSETLELEFIENRYSPFHKISYDPSISFEENVSTNCSSSIQDCYVKVYCNETKNSNQNRFDEFVKYIESLNPFDVCIVDTSIVISEEELQTIETTTPNQLIGLDSLSLMNSTVDGIDGLNQEQKASMKSILSEMYVEALS